MFWRKPPTFLVHFNDGAVVRMLEGSGQYRVRFLADGDCRYENSLTRDRWLKTNQAYLVPWRIEILDRRKRLVLAHDFDLAGKTVRINIDSRSLGDTLAWIPQVQRFADRHPETRILLSLYFKGLDFAKCYPRLEFIDPEAVREDVYATFDIGFFFDCIPQRHPVDPRTVPLGRVAADILGLEYRETRPSLPAPAPPQFTSGPYVCIATHSTAACKYWQHDGGWQQVVDHLRKQGLQVLMIQKEKDRLEGVVDRTGDLPLQQRISDLAHCEFFIGLGSGLSWLAWALGKPVVLISGFSEPYAEFGMDCIRIINREVCHGCWNDTAFAFDRGDWNWCPRHAGTARQFECSREIQPGSVIDGIDRLIRLRREASGTKV